MKLPGWLRRLLAPRPAQGGAAGADADDETGPQGDAEVDLFDPFPEPVRLEIRDVFDLHAFAPRDVGNVVAEYLREARRAGFRQVRIIHGKGTGTQRERVRRILARTRFVESYSDAPAEAGGWGATVARLAPGIDEDDESAGEGS